MIGPCRSAPWDGDWCLRHASPHSAPRNVDYCFCHWACSCRYRSSNGNLASSAVEGHDVLRYQVFFRRFEPPIDVSSKAVGAPLKVTEKTLEIYPSYAVLKYYFCKQGDKRNWSTRERPSGLRNFSPPTPDLNRMAGGQLGL